MRSRHFQLLGTVEEVCETLLLLRGMPKAVVPGLGEVEPELERGDDVEEGAVVVGGGEWLFGATAAVPLPLLHTLGAKPVANTTSAAPAVSAAAAKMTLEVLLEPTVALLAVLPCQPCSFCCAWWRVVAWGEEGKPAKHEVRCWLLRVLEGPDDVLLPSLGVVGAVMWSPRLPPVGVVSSPFDWGACRGLLWVVPMVFVCV